MENNKNKKSVKFQGDMLNFCDFIQVFVFTRNHHLNGIILTLACIACVGIVWRSKDDLTKISLSIDNFFILWQKQYSLSPSRSLSPSLSKSFPK